MSLTQRALPQAAATCRRNDASKGARLGEDGSLHAVPVCQQPVKDAGDLQHCKARWGCLAGAAEQLQLQAWEGSMPGSNQPKWCVAARHVEPGLVAGGADGVELWMHAQAVKSIGMGGVVGDPAQRRELDAHRGGSTGAVGVIEESEPEAVRLRTCSSGRRGVACQGSQWGSDKCA
jgi:hypothetical protein